MRRRLPDNVSFDLGALLEPLGVAIHASRRAQLIPGSTVLVFGAGAVGLLCAAISKVSKAKAVIIADIQAERVDFAVENGFAHAGFVVPRKQGTTTDEKLQHAKDLAALAGQTETATGLLGGVDMAFECTGVEACTQAAIHVSYRPLYTPGVALTIAGHTRRRQSHASRHGQSDPNATHLGGSVTRSRSRRRLSIREYVRGGD